MIPSPVLEKAGCESTLSLTMGYDRHDLLLGHLADGLSENMRGRERLGHFASTTMTISRVRRPGCSRSSGQAVAISNASFVVCTYVPFRHAIPRWSRDQGRLLLYRTIYHHHKQNSFSPSSSLNAPVSMTLKSCSTLMESSMPASTLPTTFLTASIVSLRPVAS